MSVAAAETAQWNPWVSAGGAVATSGSSRGEAIYWAPLWQTPSSVGFLDFRGKIFDGSYLEGNVALGARTMLPGGYNFGVWGGYDARRSGATGNVFQQLSGGVELLGDRLAFRANGYLPLSGAAAGTPMVFLSGNDILMSGGQEIPLHGVDGEAGAQVFASGGPGAPKQELWAYGGAFWFASNAAAQTIAGPKVRAEWRINDVLPSLPGSRLSLGAMASHDDVRNTRFEVSASLRIPLGGATSTPASAQEARMADPLVRDTDIVVEGTTEHVADDITGVHFDRALTVGAGDDLQAAITAAGLNSLLIVNGDRIGSWALGDSQTLLGGGGTIAVRGLTTGTVADFTAAGARPVLQDVHDDFYVTQRVLIANDNTHFAGLEVDSVGKQIPNNYEDITYITGSIYGEGVDNVAVTGNLLKTSVDFHDPGAGVLHSSSGAQFRDSSNVIVDGNEVHADGLLSFGIALSGDAAQSSHVDNNVIYVSGGSSVGVQYYGTGGVHGNQIDLSGDTGRGIVLSRITDVLVDYNRVTISDGDASKGIVFNSPTRSKLDHNTVTGVSTASATVGIDSQLGTNSYITNNLVSVSGVGINVLVGSDNLEISGNTLTTGSTGIHLDNGSYLLADNLFTGAVGGTVVALANSHANILTGSTGNSIAAGTTGVTTICGGTTFNGTWSIMDDRAPAQLHTYAGSCNEP
ncbi:MAG TPA: right-handed parallel beta-helix repeat-containing protein [Bauldia sp.]|nr:right-handed parallel beta-helix repeat-containing protein [Bauldia sp.]